MIRELTAADRAYLTVEPLPDLALLVAQLHRCREDYRQVSEQHAAELKAWETEHAELLRRCRNLQQAVTAADTALREAATAAHARTGDKHPAPGISIKAHPKLVYQEDVALEWCKTYLPVALVRHPNTLNRSVFEATAEALGIQRINDEWSCDLLQEETRYVVNIDRDLSKALVEESR